MYERSETDIARRHLEEVVRSIDDPIVIIGGWAVQFLVNERYRESTGRDHIGSMDIDLGFAMGDGALEKTTLARVLRKLEGMGFAMVGFRLQKQVNLATGETLPGERAKALASYEIFQMNVDLVVDTIPKGFRKAFGFAPIDEPLLGTVFSDPTKRVERQAFGRTVWVPRPDILLAMKVRSLPGRQLGHKKLKDVADVAALVLFGGARLGDLVGLGLASEENLRKFKRAITPEDRAEAARLIGVDVSLIDAAIPR
ncbi:MAG: hypothetical protein AB1665_05695 [Candidatus Thermoplasmatota archaeon]